MNSTNFPKIPGLYYKFQKINSKLLVLLKNHLNQFYSSKKSFKTIDLTNKWTFLLPLSRLFFPYQSANETHRFQAIQGHKDGLEASAVVLLQTCLGLAAALGCAAWGVVTARPSAQCLVSRQYLCQAALLGVGQYTTRYVVVARILEPRCRVAKRVGAGRRRKRNVSRSLVSGWEGSLLEYIPCS